MLSDFRLGRFNRRHHFEVAHLFFCSCQGADREPCGAGWVRRVVRWVFACHYFSWTSRSRSACLIQSFSLLARSDRDTLT